jgi:hypothetical protein
VAVALALGALSAACAGGDDPTAPAVPPSSAALVDSVALGSRSGIAVRRTGGVAALQTDAAIDSASGRFVIVTRRLCVAPSCSPPLDSAVGTAPPENVRALFATVAREHALDLRSDYGTCTRCADQQEYTTTLHLDGRRKVVHADDGTIPAPLARVHDAFWRVIDVARGR